MPNCTSTDETDLGINWDGHVGVYSLTGSPGGTQGIEEATPRFVQREGTLYRGHKNRGFSNTDRRVIELVAQGLKNSEIAEVMCTTEHVIKNYLRVIYDTLGFHNRVEIALWYEARRHGHGSSS